MDITSPQRDLGVSVSNETHFSSQRDKALKCECHLQSKGGTRNRAIFRYSFVRYERYSLTATINILNVLFIIMVICGIVISIKTKLMQLLLCFLSIDIFIHLVCCFGISELYIYSPHYLFIFVFSIGYLIKHTVGLINVLIITIIVLMAFTLYIYNISEIINYLS